jgi:hypothetical protein
VEDDAMSLFYENDVVEQSASTSSFSENIEELRLCEEDLASRHDNGPEDWLHPF